MANLQHIRVAPKDFPGHSIGDLWRRVVDEIQFSPVRDKVLNGLLGYGADAYARDEGRSGGVAVGLAACVFLENRHTAGHLKICYEDENGLFRAIPPKCTTWPFLPGFSSRNKRVVEYEPRKFRIETADDGQVYRDHGGNELFNPEAQCAALTVWRTGFANCIELIPALHFLDGQALLCSEADFVDAWHEAVSRCRPGWREAFEASHGPIAQRQAANDQIAMHYHAQALSMPPAHPERPPISYVSPPYRVTTSRYEVFRALAFLCDHGISTDGKSPVEIMALLQQRDDFLGRAVIAKMHLPAFRRQVHHVKEAMGLKARI